MCKYFDFSFIHWLIDWLFVMKTNQVIKEEYMIVLYKEFLTELHIESTKVVCFIRFIFLLEILFDFIV